jgi:hypothetical protein
MSPDIIYKQLPTDIQLYISKFIPIWQRYGFKKPPKLSTHSLRYYNHIRKIPRGIHWKPDFPRFFYYRRQRDYFNWTLIHDYQNLNHTKEYWSIEMTPQWDFCRHDGLIQSMRDTKFYNHVECPSIIKFIRATISQLHVWSFNQRHQILTLEFEVFAPDIVSGLTKQTLTDALCVHMINLSREAEKIRKIVELNTKYICEK